MCRFVLRVKRLMIDNLRLTIDKINIFWFELALPEGDSAGMSEALSVEGFSGCGQKSINPKNLGYSTIFGTICAP